MQASVFMTEIRLPVTLISEMCEMNEGRKEGRKEGKEGRKEGRKEGMRTLFTCQCHIAWEMGDSFTAIVLLSPRRLIQAVFYWDQPFKIGCFVWAFSCSIEKKTRFQLVWLINSFNQLRARVKLFKTMGSFC